MAALNDAETEYNNHLPYGPIRDLLKDRMKTLLRNFVNGDYLMWERFGKEGGGSWQLDPFFDAYYRETVRNPRSPEAAMRVTAEREPEAWPSSSTSSNVLALVLRRRSMPLRCRFYFREVGETRSSSGGTSSR